MLYEYLTECKLTLQHLSEMPHNKIILIKIDISKRDKKKITKNTNDSMNHKGKEISGRNSNDQ